MPVSDPAAVARDVVFGYNDHIAVDRSTFEVPAGSITALIGPNGSGKSTLLSGIAGLLRPSSGSLHLSPINGRRRRVAYVLQTTKVNEALPITVREVVTMGRYATTGGYGWLSTADKAIVSDAMERMSITDLARRHLHELSGGQRQRVFVAQGLAQDHDVLLLDEPLTGLDMTSAIAIDEVIHDEHSRGCTIMITTHDLTEARAADHVLLMASRVVASGPPDEVLTRTNLTDAYGQTLLHYEGERILLDDPAHRPAESKHVHQERSIHVEPGEHRSVDERRQDR